MDGTLTLESVPAPVAASGGGTCSCACARACTGVEDCGVPGVCVVFFISVELLLLVILFH